MRFFLPFFFGLGTLSKLLEDADLTSTLTIGVFETLLLADKTKLLKCCSSPTSVSIYTWGIFIPSAILIVYGRKLCPRFWDSVQER